MLSQHEQLEGRLQDLRAWVGSTNLLLSSKEYNDETNTDSLKHRLQQFEVGSPPILKCVFIVLRVASVLFSCKGNWNLYFSFSEKLIFHFRNKVCHV